MQHTRQPAGRIKRVSVAVLLDNVPRPGAKGKMVEQPLTAAELTRIEGLVKQAVGFDAARGDTVSVMNAPFVREAVAGEEGPKWWEDPRVQNGLRLLVGALVVLALLFGVVRPTLRQLTGVTPSRKSSARAATMALHRAPTCGWSMTRIRCCRTWARTPPASGRSANRQSPCRMPTKNACVLHAKQSKPIQNVLHKS